MRAEASNKTIKELLVILVISIFILVSVVGIKIYSNLKKQNVDVNTGATKKVQGSKQY